MDEQSFKQLLAEKPYDPEVLTIYGDWLEENGRDDEVLAIQLQRKIAGRVVVLTRQQAKESRLRRPHRATGSPNTRTCSSS